MTTATPLHRSRQAFAPLQLMVTEATVLKRRTTGPDDPKAEQFWQAAARFKDAEKAARQETGWRSCIYGPAPAHCPEMAAVSCNACGGKPYTGPLKVISTRIETDEDGQRREVFELDM